MLLTVWPEDRMLEPAASSVRMLCGRVHGSVNSNTKIVMENKNGPEAVL